MKVGIITIVDYKNYGNRLQNYALQETLKSLGTEVETIVNVPYNSQKNLPLLSRYWNRIMELGISGNVDRIKEKLKGEPKEKLLEKKKHAFREFTNQWINETDYKVNPLNLPENLGERYDYFVTGSDQVWNPNYRNGSAFDFLTFAPINKRIAYAPSFGVSNIPDEHKENYAKWLSEMGALSVREHAGATLIKKLTGKKSPVHVDPTVLLTKETWEKFARPSSVRPKGKYLLTYYLGKISSDKQQLINDLANENNLEIVNLSSYDDSKYYDLRPDEFVDMIQNAEIFLTDSFHGAVFSILMETPFVIFKRISKVPSMNSRIDTLLDKFQLSNRKYGSLAKEELFNIDFSHVAAILEKERNKSLTYLRQALSIKEAE